MPGMQRGLAAALLRELHLRRYAVQARNVQARKSWIVEQASTFCGLLDNDYQPLS